MHHHHLSLSAMAGLIPLALSCAPVNIIAARGSIEPQGVGFLGPVAKAAAAQIPGAVITALKYPALLDPYPPSVAQGVGNMTELLLQQAQDCPDTKIVLIGFSQGAQVSLDTLCGTSDGPTFPATPAQAPKVGGKIAAVVLFGDPTFVADQPFSKGTAKSNGVFPRKDLSPCQNLVTKFASYCDDTDLFCASGSNLDVHLAYFKKQNYIESAASFIVQNVR